MLKTPHLSLALALLGLVGCGLSSVSPVVTAADAQFDARLLGTWLDSAGKESVVFARADSGQYQILYTDDHGKTGAFHARLGRIGLHRVLDAQPDDPAPGASDLYRSLLVGAHGMVVVDSVGTELRTRLLDPDSARQFLTRQTGGKYQFLRVDDTVILTGTTANVRSFLVDILDRPGMLGEAGVMRRPKR